LKDFQEKTMQTLTAGSFLNLENDSTVEALKFTARGLAEMTTAVVAENLTAEALKNLANDLWQKAEYVARETERRRLHEIFVENFSERFRELKPEVSAAEILSVVTQPDVATAEKSNSAEQSPASIENIPTTKPPTESATEVEGKKDEFLGFVKSGEPFIESPPATETGAAGEAIMRDAPEKTEQESVQAEPEDERLAGEEVSKENPKETHPPATVASAADTKTNPQPAMSAVKNSAPKAATTDAKEPFEFGKCTINLNLTLLPSSGDGRGRRAIVSAASHNLPPEIEFLEIVEGENLAEIAGLVRGKLERFKQTLPTKYIEQLRASKTKTAKKAATAKPSTAATAPTKPEINQATAEKTSGEQKTRNLSDAEAEKNRTEIAAIKENSAAQLAPLPQAVAVANNVQPSLF
jgi:hypothetical protein